MTAVRRGQQGDGSAYAMARQTAMSSAAPVFPASALVSSNKFAALGSPKRIWAIGAVHGAVALVLFGVAVTAAMRVPKPAAVEEPTPAQVA